MGLCLNGLCEELQYSGINFRMGLQHNSNRVLADCQSYSVINLSIVQWHGGCKWYAGNHIKPQESKFMYSLPLRWGICTVQACMSSRLGGGVAFVGFAFTRNARIEYSAEPGCALGCGCHWDRASVAWGRCGNTVSSSTHRVVWGRRGNSARPWADSWYSCETPAPLLLPQSSVLTVTSSQLTAVCVRALELAEVRWRHLYLVQYHCVLDK